MPTKDREKANKQNRDYYHRNKERILAKLRDNHKEYYQKNKERLLKNSERYKDRHPCRSLLSSIKCRCKRDNIPFNLEEADIVIPDACPLLGIKLEFRSGNWENSPSIDRIIPSLGYVKGNVWIISMRANRIKCNATLEELQMIVKNLNDRFNTNKTINEVLT